MAPTRISPEARDLLREARVIELQWLAEETRERLDDLTERRRLLQRLAAEMRIGPER